MPAQQVSTELPWANIIVFGVHPMNTNPVEGTAIREHGCVWDQISPLEQRCQYRVRIKENNS